MPATLNIELGPCDDIGKLYVNGLEIETTNLDEVRRAERVIPDGDYEVRLEVYNPGLWAWRAAVRLRGEGYEILAIDEKGGSGLFGGKVYEGKWQLRSDNGKLQILG